MKRHLQAAALDLREREEREETILSERIPIGRARLRAELTTRRKNRRVIVTMRYKGHDILVAQLKIGAEKLLITSRVYGQSDGATGESFVACLMTWIMRKMKSKRARELLLAGELLDYDIE